MTKFQLIISKQYMESIVHGLPILVNGCATLDCEAIPILQAFRTKYDNEFDCKEYEPTIHWFIKKCDVEYYELNKKTILSHIENSTGIVWGNIRNLLD